MAHSLDVVPVGIEHEGGIVIRVIMRAQTRRAVVLAARGKASLVKCIHGARDR